MRRRPKSSLLLQAIHDMRALKFVMANAAPESDRQNRIDLAQKVAADHFGVTVEDLKSRSRKGNIERARKMAVWLCCDVLHLKQTEVAAAFGRTQPNINWIRNVTRHQIQFQEADRNIAKTLEVNLQRELSLAALQN